MDSILLLVAVSASLCFCMAPVHGQASVLKIFFAEVDFREVEGLGRIDVKIIKEGPLIDDLYMNVIPLTYAEFDIRGFPLGDIIRAERPDPAEYDVNGRMDFDNTVQEVVLRAGTSSDDYLISIPVTRDSFNEANEGFMIVMRPDETRSNTQDVANINYQNDGVALGVIDDDDPIVLGFERSTYTVREEGRIVEDLVALVKQEGQITEQTLTLAVNTFGISAVEGMDFERIRQLNITFLPEEMKKNLSFTLLDDAVTEPTERFGLLVSRQLDSPTIVLGIDTAVITIEETDTVVITFNESVYIVNEGDTVLVCVDIEGDRVIDNNVVIVLSLTPTSGSASIDLDFTLPTFLGLNNDVRQACVEIETLSDRIPEPTENVTLTITKVAPESENIITTSTTTIIINSDECIEGTNDCFNDSFCTDTYTGFECRCPEGYVDRDGNGKICDDLNECLDSRACGPNSICSNTEGSFLCQCVDGFRGDGITCTDVNECNEGLDDCAPDAICSNTPGSYSCQCPPGLTGDGRECVILQPPLIDECDLDLDDCSPNANCIDLDDGFDCVCKSGYIGDGRRCTDINECMDDNRCRYPNLLCVNTEGSYSCVCKPGYVPMIGNMCFDFDECSAGSDNCDSNARCINSPGSYSCECNAGFTGDGFTCIAEQQENCPPGYSRWGSKCMDINECAYNTDSCDENAICTNTLGSYTCRCRDGFEGDGFSCRLRDEPMECGAGYRPWGRKCMDINECRERTDDCDENAFCTNTLGSYECTCRSGYTGDGRTCTAEQLDPCEQLDDEEDEDSSSTSHSRSGTKSKSGTKSSSRTKSSSGTKSKSSTKSKSGSSSTTKKSKSSRGTSRSRRWANMPPLCRQDNQRADSHSPRSRSSRTHTSNSRRT